jgi:hypothetical protein
LNRFLKDPPHVFREGGFLSHGLKAAALAPKEQKPPKAALIVDLAHGDIEIL